MGGFLNALSFLAPVGETLGGAMQQGQQRQEREASQQAFGKLLEGLGPEYEPFRQYYKAGGTPHDVSAAISGPIGAQLRQQATAGQVNKILESGGTDEEIARQLTEATSDPKYWEDFALGKLKASQKQNKFGTPDEMKTTLQNYANTPGLPPSEQALFRSAADSGDPNFMDMALNRANLPELVKPKEPPNLSFTSGTTFDPNSGLSFKTNIGRDPKSGAIVSRQLAGLDLSPTDKEQLSQAQEALHFMGDANGAAQHLDARFKSAGWDSRTVEGAQKQRAWLNDQWRRYTAAREAAGLNPLNPESWFFQHYGGVNDEANRYFTLMGQINQQMSAPMHIFRAVGLYNQISQHIPIPQDLPTNNIDRIKQAQARFGYEIQRVNEAQENLGLFPSVSAPGYGAGNGGPSAAPSGAPARGQPLTRDQISDLVNPYRR